VSHFVLDLCQLAANATLAVALMDLGYVTHATHANSRLVYLTSSLSDDKKTLMVTGPPNGNIYPPGPGWLYVVVGDTVSKGIKVMVGDGTDPPFDEEALNKYVHPFTYWYSPIDVASVCLYRPLSTTQATMMGNNSLCLSVAFTTLQLKLNLYRCIWTSFVTDTNGMHIPPWIYLWTLRSITRHVASYDY
jgi:Domain of unknown function (DUF1929)